MASAIATKDEEEEEEEEEGVDDDDDEASCLNRIFPACLMISLWRIRTSNICDLSASSSCRAVSSGIALVALICWLA